MTPDGLKRLELDEGKRNLLYDDITGHTYSAGDFGDHCHPSIGIGRNLVSKGLTDAEVMYLFNNDVAECEATMKQRWITGWRAISDVAKDVVVMVHFNTGNVFGWPKFLAALAALDYKTAAAELMDSDTARGQGEARYSRMRDALLTGKWKLT